MELACFPLKRGPQADRADTVGGWQITSYFGPRIDPIRGGAGNHGGQDIAGFLQGEPYYAGWDGMAYPVWDGGGGGNWTTLYHASGARIGYGHQVAFASGWKAGGVYKVNAGDLIGYANSTGASTGTHLHFAYDSEDANSYYDDPYDILKRCAARGAFPGNVTQYPTQPLPEGLTMPQFDDLMKELGTIKNAVLPMQFVAENAAGWEADTRLIVVNGVKFLLDEKVAGLEKLMATAKFDSREFPFCYQGGNDVWMWVDTSEGLRRQWIKTPESFGDLTKTRLNPFVVVHDASRRAAHDAEFPAVGDVPKAA